MNQTNSTNDTDKGIKFNETNETISDNKNKTENKTKAKKKPKMKKKEEWKTVHFQHQLNEKNKKSNLCFFMSLLFRQPRLEYALHRLAYEEKNKLEDFNEKIWIPHLLYRLFNEKAAKENITKIKIEKVRFYFSKYSDNNFRSSFLSKYLDDTNLTQIEEYLKKHNSSIIDKDYKINLFHKIPLSGIIFTLIFIFITIKLYPYISGEEKNKDNEENGEENQNDNKENK